MDSQDFHVMRSDEVLTILNSSNQGLSSKEATIRLEKYGLNELVESKKRTIKDMIIEQFKDFLIILLIIAAAISFLIFAWETYNHNPSSEWLEGLVILAIIIVNAIIGVKQEYSSEKSLEALKKMAAPKATVIRDNEQMEIWGRELVPGDIVVLNTGDKVPADLRIIESINLKIEEAALTGESVPTKKISDPIPDPNVSLNERKNMAYASTIVTYGRGKAVVTSTGMNTEIGRIAEMIQSVEEKKTPLQKKLEILGKNLGKIIIIICTIVFVTAILREYLSLKVLTPTIILDLFTAAVGLAVAAVPEGLPAIVTVCLSLGVTRMVAKHAIIRKLPAVETLGCATVICSDKTGTLTQNEMTVKKIFLTDKKEIEVTGIGYAPEGDFLADGKKILLKSNSDLNLLLEIGALCNDAILTKNKHEGSEKWKIIGDPTEGALLTDAAKAGLWKEKLEEKYPRIGEIPFDSGRKRMGTIHEKKNKILLYVKGAPESVLEQSSYMHKNGAKIPLSQQEKEEFLKINSNMAKNALRVLGYAYKEIDPKLKEYDESIETDLIFVGMSGMIDPPREEVKEALKKARSAGMKAKMITGDNKETAIAIGKELGFAEGKIIGLTGSELNKMSDDELYEKVEDISIYARSSPEHKVRICTALQRRNHVVAMTGDGVNDAPALKNAEIGIAMGITGTDVSKEASDMILTDDNFATIVEAIEEGRGIYDNIGKFLFYLLSSNTGEILTMFFSIIIGFIDPATGMYVIPLSAITILWINLVTDGLPATALSVDPPDPDLMKRPPRDPNEGVFPIRNLINMMIVGVNMAIGTIMIFWVYLNWGQIIDPHIKLNDVYILASTMAFTVLVFYQLYNVFMCRSHTKSFFRLGSSNKSLIVAVIVSILLQLIVIYIPGLTIAFHTIPLSFIDWLIVIGVSATIVPTVEIYKIFLRKKSYRN
ncbi:MAG: calcium-translocating P-type ATPase, SERCA-type [Candidatus Helarchaeota archaeon]